MAGGPPKSAVMSDDTDRDSARWWRSAVIYQVYIRSFADGNGDGIGDIAGLRSRLGYLAGLGVDAVWITPWYRSPMKDALGARSAPRRDQRGGAGIRRGRRRADVGSLQPRHGQGGLALRAPQHIRPARHLSDMIDLPADLSVGLRRARAAALLMLALPGGAYLYQGEELGLAEVEDLPEEALTDPAWQLSGHTNRGRDGCRVPLPWSGEEPPFGFSPPGSFRPPWLPQPAAWRGVTVEAQAKDPGSTLELFRRALEIRRRHPALGAGSMEWLDRPAGVLSFTREPGFACLVNVTGEPVPVLSGAVLLASGDLTDEGLVPRDSTVWLDR